MDETILDLTAQIVSDFVRNNAMPTDQLPALIQAVHRALSTVGQAPAQSAKAEPAVDVKKSVSGDHLVCLACGKHFRTIKRHLRTEHEMTPEQYRERFGLSHSYPMVAPDYAKFRSGMAKRIGLGVGGRGKASKKAGRKRG
jgi:predicted transcriptional regulator